MSPKNAYFQRIYCFVVFTAKEDKHNWPKGLIASSLREHLRTHETFIVDQIVRDFLHNYHKFSIKSYVVAIY